jgi:signal transduction histidine kinase/CheY-like chemotaxis protein
MASRLRESYAGLETKVAERTAQLSEARDSLQARAAEVDALNTRLIQQVDELALRRDEAERANAAKTRFLATASHDLRQPMHSISLLIGLLRERIEGDEPASLAEMVQTSVDSMERLFGSLLDISRLDAGAVSPRVEDVDVAVLLERLERTWAPQAQARRLRLRVHRPRARLRVRTDPALLERIVGNLVSNAIRYTARGGVLVAARRRGDACRLEVRDTGRGIPDDCRDAVFEEFFRVDTPGETAEKGLGLGLSIVRRSAAILGHRVGLQSRVGRGSTFCVDVPLSEPAGPGPWTAEDAGDGSDAAADVASLSGVFVLVVDDDATNRRALAGVLGDCGCLVAVAGSADEAVATLDQHLRMPDLVIADYQLGRGATGLEAIARVRAQAEEAIPALLLTAQTDADEAIRDEAARLGVSLLHKPMGARRLLREAVDALRLRATGAAGASG